MTKITVYRFTVYDITTDERRLSRRWATREAIENIGGGKVLEDTATEVDASAVGADEPGMTDRGFDPHRGTGQPRFQTSVKP